MLKAAGWRDVAIATRVIGMDSLDGVEATAEFAAMMGPTSNLLREHQPDAAIRARIVAEITEGFRAIVGEGEIVLPATIHIAAARNG